MFNLDKLLQIVFGNQAKAARFFGVSRSTLRNNIKNKNDFIVKNGKVYKQIGSADFKQLKESERLRLKESLMDSYGECCIHCLSEVKPTDTTCCNCGGALK